MSEKEVDVPVRGPKEIVAEALMSLGLVIKRQEEEGTMPIPLDVGRKVLDIVEILDLDGVSLTKHGNSYLLGSTWGV